MARPAREEIVAKIIKMIHDFVPELENADLTEESRINTDAAMDSMSLILVITKIESAFDIRIPHKEWDSIMTLGQLADAVERHLPKE
ncbi:MAG: hypothetical protein IJJ50_09460 [Lachnospiraceae bacterium]|nr:hypothetical protein [Lachnospiraceae bacterium]